MVKHYTAKLKFDRESVPDVEAIRAHYTYDAKEGALYYRVRGNRPGEIWMRRLFGNYNDFCKRRVKFRGFSIPLDALIFYHQNGRLPIYNLTHRNGDQHDNHIENLADLPPAEEFGVYYRFGKWEVRLTRNGSTHYVGRFTTKPAAMEAKRKWLGEYGE